MLRTKNLVSSMYDVPVEWIFEHYLSLPESLSGQDVNITSVLSPKDMNPSLFIYYSKTGTKYKWKDFSAGKQGDGIELVKELFKLPRRFDAASKIINEYNEFVLSNGKHNVVDFKVHAKYKVNAVKPRQWTESDAKYWQQYKIGSDLLEKFNVKPLEYFRLIKEDIADQLVIRSAKLYGYFRADNTLYKLYQPMLKDNKFFKVKNYIQGADQLTYQVPYLILCSSLKDLMAFTKLGFKNAECIAPDSENVMIPEKTIQKLKSKYTTICTLFDNDEAGVNSMQKYKQEYDIPFAHLKVEKDLADCVKTHGLNNTKELLYPSLVKALKGTIKNI